MEAWRSMMQTAEMCEHPGLDPLVSHAGGYTAGEGVQSVDRMNGSPGRIPLLEFDGDVEAVVEPARVIRHQEVPEACVLCFFGDVVESLRRLHRLRIAALFHSEAGTFPLYSLDIGGAAVGLFQSPVGAPAAAAFLEELIAAGCRRFVACGGAGVLRRDIAVGRVVVPDAAVRDEGTSYHYLPPSRKVVADEASVAALVRVLERRHVPYLRGTTWTTDAGYRETRAAVERHRAEGCLTVEMEAAAFMAVAQFRGVRFAQVLYAGDDLSGVSWDNRSWLSRQSVREQLVWLSAEAALELPAERGQIKRL
jgi:uridine phosphorylase